MSARILVEIVGENARDASNNLERALGDLGYVQRGGDYESRYHRLVDALMEIGLSVGEIMDKATASRFAKLEQPQ